tara:strand:+ start:478 stop:750 length:273 start_codon:yes stop_codon:yes gene_type:complete
MRPNAIENILVGLRTGGWFGFGGKEKTYANLIIHTDDDKPTQEWLEAELKRQQDAWDTEQVAKQERLDSVKSKLESLGLTTEEVKEAFGI